jgi:hypothetical protein
VPELKSILRKHALRRFGMRRGRWRWLSCKGWVGLKQGQAGLGRRNWEQPLVASPSYLFCSFARGVSGITGSFLFDLQVRLAFGLFGSDKSLSLLGLPLVLQGEFGCTGRSCGQFGLTHLPGDLSLSGTGHTRLVHRRSGGAPIRDAGLYGRPTKLLQHRLFGRGGAGLTLLMIWVFEAAH